MSEKELDEILKEIKEHSNPDNSPNSSEKTEFSSKKREVPVDEDKIKNNLSSDSLSSDNHKSDYSLSENNTKESYEANKNETKEEEQDLFEISSDYDLNNNEDNIPIDRYTEYDNLVSEKENGNKSKKIIAIIISVVLIIALGVGIYFGFFHNKSEEPETTKPTETQQTEQSASGIKNPLTGEDNYNENAVGKRPVAVVVENEYSTESVRPQWGLSDADIVLEGESEYSTRLLLFWADYTDMPEKVGPCRSARPPFIRFSQLFDSVFIHCGLSKSKGNYTGANTVFESENVDHINGLKDTMNGTYFGRNKERTSTVEHTAYLNGKNVAELLEKNSINTKLDESKFSTLNFNDEAKPTGENDASSVSFIFSDAYSTGRCPKTAKFVYDEASAKYTTEDFDSQYGTSDAKFENLIFLLDETEYVVKENYKNSGKSETYCDYKLSGGKGTVVSEGKATDITWGTENGKLWMKSADGNDLSLNPGKIYIGYGSSNHGGKVTLNPQE